MAALNVPEMSSRRARASGDFEVKNRRLERGEIGKHVEVCPRATRPDVRLADGRFRAKS